MLNDSSLLLNHLFNFLQNTSRSFAKKNPIKSDSGKHLAAGGESDQSRNWRAPEKPFCWTIKSKVVGMGADWKIFFSSESEKNWFDVGVISACEFCSKNTQNMRAAELCDGWSSQSETCEFTCSHECRMNMSVHGWIEIYVNMVQRCQIGSSKAKPKAMDHERFHLKIARSD